MKKFSTKIVLPLLGLATVIGLSSCQSSSPPSSDEHAGHTTHVHKDGSTHYHE